MILNGLFGTSYGPRSTYLVEMYNNWEAIYELFVFRHLGHLVRSRR